MTDLIVRIDRYISFSKYTHPVACLLLEEASNEIRRLRRDGRGGVRENRTVGADGPERPTAMPELSTGTTMT